jgi:excisionase family DNA binding protein
MPDAVLTVAEVAGRLRVTHKTVRKFIHNGSLKASNLGTRKRPRYAIQAAFLKAFLEARQVVGIESDGGE